MNRNLLLSVILIAVLALGTMMVFASVDDQGNPNDPFTNDRANACYEGGSLEGKCNDDGNGDGVVTDAEIQLQWTCGWYLIRVEAGIYSRDGIPAFCNTFLPPLPVLEDAEEEVGVEEEAVEPEVTVEPPVVNCVTIDGFDYLDFGAGNYLATGTTIYSDNACTVSYYPSSAGFALATNQTEADNICSTNEPGTTGNLVSGNVYVCID